LGVLEEDEIILDVRDRDSMVSPTLVFRIFAFKEGFSELFGTFLGSAVRSCGGRREAPSMIRRTDISGIS